MFRSIPVKREGRETIGESVTRVVLDATRRENENWRLVAIVPRMLSFFATAPERYEVTEVDILVEDV